MPSVTQVAEEKRAKGQSRNGADRPVKTWPPLEPVMPYFQIKCFPRRLHDRLRILAILKHKGVPEVASEVIERGLDAVENEANAKRTE